MASIRIPRLVGKTNKAGLTNWYWQPSKTVRALGWELVHLGAAAGADPPDAVVTACRARNAAYDDWRGGGARPAAVPRPAPILTLGHGIAAFKAEGYPSVKRPGEKVSAGTRRQYASKLKVLERWGGDVALRSIDPDRVAVLKDALMKPAASGPRKGEVRHPHAHETLRVGRTLFTWFEQKRWLPKGANPFENFALAAPPPRDQIWQVPAREAILAAADAAALPNMALAVDLAFSIGQREADLLRIGLRQYAEIPGYKMDPDVFETLSRVPVPAYGGRAGYVPGNVFGIRVRQAKTKRWVEVPIVGLTRARVEAAIEEAKALGLTILLRDERTGLPWTMPNLATGQEYFIRRFAELRAAAIAAARADGEAELAAEIEGLQFRDFRRTAVVYMGELGIPDHLIAAITGHDLDETRKILDTYMPRTTAMAARAIALSQARAPAAAEKEKQA